MKFKDFKIVCVDLEYLKALHEVDSEVMYRKSAEYAKKPFLGILVTNANKKVCYSVHISERKAQDMGRCESVILQNV